MIDTPFTRRDFLKAGGAVLATAALPSSVRPEGIAPPSKANKREIKKGIMWACVQGQMSVMDKFKMIKEAGFEGTEIDGGMDRAEVLKARDATGLLIPSVICATHWLKPLSDPNPAVRAAGLEGLKTALHDGKEYGSSSVLFVPAVVKKEVSYDQAYIRSQAEIKKVVPLADELGVKIAIENVWNNFLLSPLEMARYVDEFNSPAVAQHFDVGNCINIGWPEHWIHILGKRIHKLHIKEYSRKKRDAEGLWKGFQVEYLEGDNDWPAVMQALDDVGYTGWGTAEPAYRPPGVDEPTRLKQIVQKMDEIYAL
jgi:L-ribulose-5-phosphate 3-epimerase